MSLLNRDTSQSLFYSEEELALVDTQKIPEHVAIVMDGNRRWAKKQGLSIDKGHWQGAEQLDVVVRAAADLGIKTLTVFSFSTENWKRPKYEVALLMKLLERYLISKKEDLVREGVRLHTIGNIERLPKGVKKILQETIETTRQGEKINLVLALNYGGRDEIRRAFLKMGKACTDGVLRWDDVTEETIASFLDTAQWNDPELFIRPSGEFRVSNFLNWQISYSEMVVTDVLWPEFSPQDLLNAVVCYQKRERRYGG
ncbi:MAG: di-trans,poly-cis-decaprenylcistransferase [Chlamydiia bacterium]|nr:di-trans,poly-cis-decaprenylcistransferase [Chlamydiia bacterium]